MKKFTKKPVTIEAVIHDNSPESFNTVHGWNDKVISRIVEDGNTEIDIPTLEGTMTAKVGDYIIRGIKGEVYPCKPDIFEASYAPAKHDEESAKVKMAKLQEAAMPLIKLLSEGYHPHHTAIVTGTSVELLEGVCSVPKIFDYVVD